MGRTEPPGHVPRDRTADRRAGIHAYDRGWQFPAITELHAYRRIRDTGGVPPGVAYVAYPWATLIDKLDVQAADAQMYLDSFHAFCLSLPEDVIRISVCQHILMPRFRHLFAAAGIEHLFWSHATHADRQAAAPVRPRVYPFPLYPVQMPEPPAEAAAGTGPRRWLYSFVGMRPNAWYLTQVRAHILDGLAGDPRGLVVGRDNWHYKQIVYRHQVLGRAPRDAAGLPLGSLVDEAASAQFRAVLCDSTFALCPSGSGPNSIRLWEAIMAGCIPVILADTYAPPGDAALWARASVTCAETLPAVLALPDRLAAIAADPARLADMRAAVAELRRLYAPAAFITDIQELMATLPGPVFAAEPTERQAAALLLAQASAVLTGAPAPHGPAEAARAQAALPRRHPVRQQYETVTGKARIKG